MYHSELAITNVGQQPGHSAQLSPQDVLASPLAELRKVCLLGFELRLPPDMPQSDGDKALRRFIKTLDSKFGPKSLDLSPLHSWVRIQDGGRPRYRFSLLLDGDKLGVTYGARVIVHDAWSAALGCSEPPSCGIVANGFVGGDGVRHEDGIFLYPDWGRFEAVLEDCLAWTSCP